MSLFTMAEIAYLQDHGIGRLATSGRTGVPHVVPTTYRFDTRSATFRIGQHALSAVGQQRLYVRHLAANPHAAFVVDGEDGANPWGVAGITIKGLAVLHTTGGEVLGPGFGPNWIEIRPRWVSSWGIDGDPANPAAPRKA